MSYQDRQSANVDIAAVHGSTVNVQRLFQATNTGKNESLNHQIIFNDTSSSTNINHQTISTNMNSNANHTSINKSPPVNSENKKHNLGVRLRRLLFGSNSNSSTLAKSKNGKDIEAGENKIFIKHNPSLHSSSSESSNEYKLENRKKLNANRTNNNGSSNHYNTFECTICLYEQPWFLFPELKTCQHRACIHCLRQYLRVEIYESRINITCPQCQELMHPNDIKAILKNDKSLIEKYELFMVRRTLITDPDVRWCPAPDCDYCVIATGCASCPLLRCERPGCETLFCYHCKQEWHPNQTCDQARAQRGLNKTVFINTANPTKSNVTFNSHSNGSYNQGHASTSVDSFPPRDDIKPCPCCKVLIIKMNDGSCNHMTCSVCGTEFCWLCMQKISDLHYLSPSGCTFWGKKPWSRKKKIMWQLGMLVGAPVGIALIAGIAVPAIIIGIPVWVGRKLYSRFERNHMSRHKSNFLVTTGVLTSIFVSPILAAVAVGVGVPILLAYVYGVVPISLCRSGGCGVTTSASGVRIELDEDEIAAPDGVSVDTALSARAVTNPSIGEVSFGMSTSLGSNSHLDRVVLDIQPDRESSSIAACAGSIASNYNNNNNNGNNNNNNSNNNNNNNQINNNNNNNNSQLNIIGQKLETFADITNTSIGNNNNNNNNAINNKRFSFSSQNADSTSVTLSFGERSINTNQSDEVASLKTHTGSIMDNSTNASNIHQQLSLLPVEVHLDPIENNNNNTNNTNKITENESNNNKQSKNELNRDSMLTLKRNLETQPPVNCILNKFESRSMEYLSNSYCNICHKSHKPCCPNFQHSNSGK